MVAVPQPGDEVDSTSPFSPSPFDGEYASMHAAGASSLLPLSAVRAPVSHVPTVSPRSGSIDTSDKIEVGEGDASTDSFSPTSAGPTPSKLFPTSPFYVHQDAVRAPAAVSCRQHGHYPSSRGAENNCTYGLYCLRRFLRRCLPACGMQQVADHARSDNAGSPKPWVGSLTVADDPRHSSPGENRFKQDQELKRSARKARQVANEQAASTEPSGTPASVGVPAAAPAPPPSPVPLKPHKLADVIGALWPQWVGQFGLVTGPSSMGIVGATPADLALVRARLPLSLRPSVAPSLPCSLPPSLARSLPPSRPSPLSQW